MFNFSDYTLKINRFGGSEKKITVQLGDKIFMLKFPDPIREKNNDLQYMYNVFSEDIGCKIFKTLGFEVQNTFLAKFDLSKFVPNGGETVVVACENFCNNGVILSEFSKFLTSDFHYFTLSHSEPTQRFRRVIPIETVINLIHRHPLLNNNPEFIEKFLEMLVVDTLIGNPDRHSDNWGFIERNGEIKFAPIYDCGSALSPLLSDDRLKFLLQSESNFKNHEYNISLAFTCNGERISCPSFYRNPPSLLQEALRRIVPKIDFVKIQDIIDNTEYISNIRKSYLLKSLRYRFDYILLPAFNKS